MYQILLISENKQELLDLSTALRASYSVKTVNSPFYAFEYLIKTRPDLIIMNINFTQSDGLAFYKKMRTISGCTDSPFIILYSDERIMEQREITENRLVELVSLPLDSQMLLSAVGSILSEKAEIAPSVVPKKYTVMVVDDDAMNLSTIRLYLESRYRIITAQSAKEALSYFETDRPHLILLDIKMPVVDGLAMFRIMRKDAKLNSIPVIFQTGLADLATVNECISIGAAGYVVKPVQKDLLVQKIDEILAKKVLLVLTENLFTTTMLRLHLEQDYKLIFAESYKHALELINTKAPELLLVDSDHPVSSYYRLQESHLTDKVPIVFLTEETSLDAINKLLAQGICGFVFKPFDKHSLQKKINEAL